MQTENTIQISNLSQQTTSDDIKKFLEPVSSEITIYLHNQLAYVAFKDSDDTESSLSYDGCVLNDQEIKIQEVSTEEEKNQFAKFVKEYVNASKISDSYEILRKDDGKQQEEEEKNQELEQQSLLLEEKKESVEDIDMAAKQLEQQQQIEKEELERQQRQKEEEEEEELKRQQEQERRNRQEELEKQYREKEERERREEQERMEQQKREEQEQLEKEKLAREEELKNVQVSRRVDLSKPASQQASKVEENPTSQQQQQPKQNSNATVNQGAVLKMMQGINLPQREKMNEKDPFNHVLSQNGMMFVFGIFFITFAIQTVIEMF